MRHSTKREIKRWAPLALVALGTILVVGALGLYAVKKLSPKSHHPNAARIAARRHHRNVLEKAYAAYHRGGVVTTTSSTTTTTLPPRIAIAIVPGPPPSCSTAHARKVNPTTCTGTATGKHPARHG